MRRRKNQRHLRPIGLQHADLVQLIGAGLKILMILQAGGVEVEPDPADPDVKQMDNTETVDAEIISSQLKK